MPNTGLGRGCSPPSPSRWVWLTAELRRPKLVHSELRARSLRNLGYPAAQVRSRSSSLVLPPSTYGGGITLQPADLWIRSDLPAGRGFSSSAAFSLVLLDGLSRLAAQPLPTQQLVELAYRLEHHHLGVQCGRLDPAACAAAQPLFTRWTPSSGDEMTMSARRITPLRTMHFVIGAFSAPRDTPKILTALRHHHQSHIPDTEGDSVREALSIFSSSAEARAHAMGNGMSNVLGEVMRHCQRTYDDALAAHLPARAPQARPIHAPNSQKSVRWVQLSGAGGDGSVIALFPEENDARSAAITLGSGA